MIGTGILSLPQSISALGYSQVFIPILFGIIASFTLWIMVWLNSKYENDSLFQINEKLLGKWLGKAINLLLALQFIVFVSGIINSYMHLIQTTALPEQTIPLPVFLFLLILVYIVNGGIKSIARFCIMTFFLTLPMCFFLIWAIQKGDISHIFPLFNFNGKELLDAMKRGYLSILGYELIMFYFPYIVDQKKAFKHSLIGIWISILFCFITVLVSVMYYSEWQLENVEYSVLHLFKAGEFSFVERIDIIGITLWVFLILSTVTVYFWAAKKGIESIRNKEKKSFGFIIILIIFGLIVMPVSTETQEKLFKLSNYAGYFLLVWPLFLCVIHFFKKRVQR